MEMGEQLQKWVDEGEVLFIEHEHLTRYGFRDGSRNETWTVWKNDFDGVHPRSQWLVDLLVRAREQITGLEYRRAKRQRRERLGIQTGSSLRKEGKQRAKLEREVRKLQRKKERLQEDLAELRRGKEKALNRQFSFHHESMSKTIFNLREELSTLKMRMWTKYGINAAALMIGSEEE